MKSERLKKWTASAVALLFGIAVIGFTIKLSYDVMVILFPQDPILRYISIALYDGGVISWLITYIARAKGTSQRGISLMMTVLDFLGVVAMVIAGIYLSGQTLADIPPWVGSAVVNVTIIAATLNAGAIYYYHAHDPDTVEAIQAQELEDDLNEEALDQARYQVQRKAQELGSILANRVTARLKYRLRLPMTDTEYSEWQGDTIDAQAYDPASLPPPPQANPGVVETLKSFFGGRQSQRRSAGTPSKNSTSSQRMEQIAQTVDARRAWDETPNGRRRLWCKDCRDLHLEWLTPEPCEHILNSTAEEHISRELALKTYQRHQMADQEAPAAS